jgi:hypothetical protein
VPAKKGLGAELHRGDQTVGPGPMIWPSGDLTILIADYRRSCSLARHGQTIPIAFDVLQNDLLNRGYIQLVFGVVIVLDGESLLTLFRDN